MSDDLWIAFGCDEASQMRRHRRHVTKGAQDKRKLHEKTLAWRVKERRLRLYIRKLVKHQLFYWIVIVLVFMNAVW